MKMIKYTPILLLLLVIASCQKEPLSKPVAFTETSYKSLGTYDADGRPNYLLTPDVITQDMMTVIQSTLKNTIDLRTTHPELLASSAIADIRVTQPSDVYLTFVAQGASKANAVAFYTYSTSTPPASAKDIDTIVYAFQNAGYKTKLVAGDKVWLGSFQPGTSIGFVLMQDAWNFTTASLNNSAVHFCSNDVLNPEVSVSLKKHAVLIDYGAEGKTFVGFEDLDRTDPKCDHDFNDVVLYTTVVPK